MNTTFNLKSLNDEADYLYYDIGVNVIPANTKEKNTFENWSQWQDNPIPIELHEQRKKNGEYGNGIAVVTGKIHKGKNEGNYFIGIDCDNKKAIDEICNSLRFKDINEMSNWTRVEQHKDNVNKAHIYILSPKLFKNKGRDPKQVEAESLDQIPAVEIKCQRQTMFYRSFYA